MRFWVGMLCLYRGRESSRISCKQTSKPQVPSPRHPSKTCVKGYIFSPASSSDLWTCISPKMLSVRIILFVGDHSCSKRSRSRSESLYLNETPDIGSNRCEPSFRRLNKPELSLYKKIFPQRKIFSKRLARTPAWPPAA